MSDWLDEHVRTLTQLSGLSTEEARRLFDRELHVSLDPNLRQNGTYRLAFAFAITMLTRIFPRTSFDDIGPEAYLIPPWGRTRPTDFHPGADPTILVFGGRSALASPEVITANCHDWHVYIDCKFKPDSTEAWNPVLALITACYAAARVTKVLLQDVVDGPELWAPFSILDFRDGRTKFNWAETIFAEEIYFGGIGAVGTSTLYALAAHKALAGRLVLVDPERVDDTNLGRYVLYDQVDIGALKVRSAEKRLRELGITNPIERIEEKFEHYFDRRYGETSSFRVAKLVSAPDQRRIRRQFQSKLPRRLWDASTGPNQVVLHHNSFEKERACLECVYPELPEENAHFKHVAETLNVPLQRVLSGEPITADDAAKIAQNYPQLTAERVLGRAFDSVFRELCSAGELRGAAANVLAPFPFISGLAGVMLYFDLIKSLRPDAFAPFQEYNYLQLNPMFPPNPDCRELRPSRADCSCQQADVQALFLRLWSGD